MSKVLLINGSSHEGGCTYTALKEVAGALEKERVETQIYQLGGNAIRDCIGCGGCAKEHKCVFDDDCVNELIEIAGGGHGRLRVWHAGLLCASQRADLVGSGPGVLCRRRSV